jgi:hypothetical protein
MEIVLVTYADIKFRASQKKLIKEARKSGVFTKILRFNETDLPDHIRKSPLFSFEYGGGYWCWKPYVLNRALSVINDNDIIVYLDAGFEFNFNANSQWAKIFNSLNSHNGVFFSYNKDINYKWTQFAFNSPKLKYWIKPEAINVLTKLNFNLDCIESSKLMAGFFILKKNNITIDIINQWLNLSYFYPELFFDEIGPKNIVKNYNCHRHDQSILTVIIYNASKGDFEINNENYEPESFNINKSVVKASRRKIALGISFFRIYRFLVRKIKSY